LEHEEVRRQRKRDAGRDLDHNHSPEWRRGEDRRREDERRFVASPSRVQKQAKRRKVGVRRFSANSRASTMATITPTPTPTPPPQSVPPSSTGYSSHSDPLAQQQGVKKPGIKCFNCGRDNHYLSACKFKAHFCDVDGHTTGMCPRMPKQPYL
jgi:hypothetical protein